MFKKLLKRMLRPLYWPFYDRFVQPLFEIQCELATLRECVSVAERSISERISAAERSMGERVSAVERSVDERISAVEHSQQEQHKQWLKTFDSRVWKAEQNGIMTIQKYGKSVRSDIFNLYFEMQRTGLVPIPNTSKNVVYNNFFYNNNRYGSVLSAQHVFFQLLRRLNVPIRSIVDFGCGTGTWLYTAKLFGITEILGLDGDYIDPAQLMISEDEFSPTNLESQVVLEKKYDMAMSLECAEHLSETAADTFVDSLCTASDIVLFSAAHPGQGGDNHINEQPIEYWQDKFTERGYSYIEIRDLYKSNVDIESWYKENISLYAKDLSIYSKNIGD